jgi:hypothetical protein
MESEHWDNPRVAQDDWGQCSRPVLFSTEGLGPCIGVCIAWGKWAALLHSSYIELDEPNLIAEMISAAKKKIPSALISQVHPVVCGGDVFADESDLSPDETPEDFEARVRGSRQRIVDILNAAGFAKSHVRWSRHGETAALIADLKAKKVSVEIDGRIVDSWLILPVPPKARPGSVSGSH